MIEAVQRYFTNSFRLPHSAARQVETKDHKCRRSLRLRLWRFGRVLIVVDLRFGTSDPCIVRTDADLDHSNQSGRRVNFSAEVLDIRFGRLHVLEQ